MPYLHPSPRPETFELDREMRWYRLDVISRPAGGPLDPRGSVECEAFWRSPVNRGSHHEVSDFVRGGGRWYYLAAT